MEHCYALCFMLMSFAISYRGTRANEMLTNVMFKVLSNEKRIDDLEVQFKTSMEGLNTRLSEELNKITDTLKQYEPSMGEIRKDIKDTISNTVTQMVKSQHVALNKAMQREKAAMLKTQTEIKDHMNLMNTAFNNSQRNYEERFTNQTAMLQDEFHVTSNQLTDNFRHAQGRFEDLFNNKTDRLDNRFDIQSGKVDHLIETVLSKSEQLNQTVEEYSEYSKNTTQSLEDGLKETLKQMKNELLKNLNDETSALKSRLTSQENSHLSLNARLTSQLNGLQSNLRSYKSAADSVGSRVSSIEKRITSHHVGFSARLTNKLPSIAKSTRIVYDEQYDGWYDYNSSTGIFTAPISGMYLFLFTVQCYQRNKAHVCLYVSGVCMREAIAGKGDDDNATGSNFYVTYLSAGTQVWVQTASLESSYDIWPWRTTLSGVLIHI